MSEQKKKWLELGVITKNEVKDKDGNVLKDKTGNAITRLGFKLSKEAHEVLLKAGFEVAQYGTLTTPVEEVERLYKNGSIGDDKIEQRRQSAKDAYSWLRYKIQLPPPKSAS